MCGLVKLLGAPFMGLGGIQTPPNLSDGGEQLRILVLCSALDLSKPHGATPFIWQFLKGLAEAGCGLVVTPFIGRGFAAPWWEHMANSHWLAGEVFGIAHDIGQHLEYTTKSESILRTTVIPALSKFLVAGAWDKRLKRVRDASFDACLAIGVPLNQVEPALFKLKRDLELPVIYYDVDAPTSLPSYGGFSFSHYLRTKPELLDGLLVPSEGSVPILEDLGARVFVVHFGVDTKLYRPLVRRKEIDVFFYGIGIQGRESYVDCFMVRPAKIMNETSFLLAGSRPNGILRPVSVIPGLRFGEVRELVSRSKVNLVITRDLQATVYATSTSRPFELGALAACMISRPYNGIENWFEVGREILVARDLTEIMELYKWLLDDDDTRDKFGNAARLRVERDHSIDKRVEQFLKIVKQLL